MTQFLNVDVQVWNWKTNEKKKFWHTLFGENIEQRHIGKSELTADDKKELAKQIEEKYGERWLILGTPRIIDRRPIGY